MARAQESLFLGGVRGLNSDMLDRTLANLLAYWTEHDEVAVAWSGGKDSTAVITLIVHLVEAGLLPKPKRLWVFYADTRQELPPIQRSAELIMAQLRQREWITVTVVCAPLDKRFWVYILGRGVPPPNNNTLRWCTRQIKVDPMTAALEQAIAGVDGTVLMITGVRQGESAVRDGRIEMSCSKDGAECGQGWYQKLLPEAKGIRGRVATLAPILHWGVCTVWDWLKVYAPHPDYGGWPTAILAEAYGGDDAAEKAARTGCIKCPLATADTALDYIMTLSAWDHLAPLNRIRPLHEWLREPAQRLRKAGAELLKSGAIAANPQRMGPLTFEARLEGLRIVLGVQDEINASAQRLGRPGIDLINAEEEARIRELIAAETWPEGWDGTEPRADRWLDSVFGDGSVQPILFRDLVGS